MLVRRMLSSRPQLVLTLPGVPHLVCHLGCNEQAGEQDGAQGGSVGLRLLTRHLGDGAALWRKGKEAAAAAAEWQRQYIAIRNMKSAQQATQLPAVMRMHGLLAAPAIERQSSFRDHTAMHASAVQMYCLSKGVAPRHAPGCAGSGSSPQTQGRPARPEPGVAA